MFLFKHQNLFQLHNNDKTREKADVTSAYPIWKKERKKEEKKENKEKKTHSGGIDSQYIKILFLNNLPQSSVKNEMFCTL